MSADRRKPAGVAVEDQRPSLVRLYGIVAWLAFVLLAVVAGLVYRRVAVGRLMYEVEGQAFTIAQRFAVTTWPDVRHLAFGAAGEDPDDLRAAGEVDTIRTALHDLIRESPTIGAELIAEDGTIIFALDPSRIGRATTDAVAVELVAGRRFGRRWGDAVSEWDRGLLTTYSLIRSDRYETEAVLAITQDVTSRLRRITRVQTVGMAGFIGVSTVTLLLIYAVWPASPPSKEGER